MDECEEKRDGSFLGIQYEGALAWRLGLVSLYLWFGLGSLGS